MTPEQVAALGPAFAAYLRDFEDCFGQGRTREHLHTYCRGLLSDLPRKSIEPIALAAGTAVRTLQEFVKDHVWDRRAVRNQLHQRRGARRTSRPPACPCRRRLGCHGGPARRDFHGEKGQEDPRCAASALRRGRQGGELHRHRPPRRCPRPLPDPDRWRLVFAPVVGRRPTGGERCREASIPDHVVYHPKYAMGLEQMLPGNAATALPWIG